MIDPSMIFKGDIIEGKKKALEEAKNDRTGLVLCTDGSKLGKGKFKATVCWKNKRVGQNHFSRRK